MLMLGPGLTEFDTGRPPSTGRGRAVGAEELH